MLFRSQFIWIPLGIDAGDGHRGIGGDQAFTRSSAVMGEHAVVTQDTVVKRQVINNTIEGSDDAVLRQVLSGLADGDPNIAIVVVDLSNSRRTSNLLAIDIQSEFTASVAGTTIEDSDDVIGLVGGNGRLDENGGILEQAKRASGAIGRAIVGMEDKLGVRRIRAGWVSIEQEADAAEITPFFIKSGSRMIQDICRGRIWR